MSNNLASKMPKTVIFSSEFDFLLPASEELAEKLKCELIVHPGAQHIFFLNPHLDITDVFFKDYANIFN